MGYNPLKLAPHFAAYNFENWIEKQDRTALCTWLSAITTFTSRFPCHFSEDKMHCKQILASHTAVRDNDPQQIFMFTLCVNSFPIVAVPKEITP